MQAINAEKYESKQENVSSFGYEIYEKNGTTYTKVGDGSIGGIIVVTVEPGVKKVYVARVFATKSNNDMKDNSKGLIIDKKSISWQ